MGLEVRGRRGYKRKVGGGGGRGILGWPEEGRRTEKGKRGYRDGEG